MKALFSVMFLLLVVSLLWGAPLRDIPTELTQPDGSTFKCYMSGDEYYHRYHDQDGFTIIQNPQTGWYVFAQKQGPDLSLSEFRAGIDNPGTAGLAPNLMPDKSILSQKIVDIRGPDGRSYGRAPTTGSINSLCIFIRFSDQSEFTDALSYYDDLHNSTNFASLNGFFLEESSNQLSVSTTFYPTPPGTTVLSYQSTFTRSYYQPQVGGNNGYTSDAVGYTRLHTLLNNAVNSIAPSIPSYLNLDMDSDGSIDNLTYVCRGNADGLGILWPHSWVLDNYLPPNNVFIPSQGITLQADDYDFLPQLNDPIYGGGGIDAALVCHEFSHTLGFPDLYHYIDSLHPCGWWDLMDTCQGTPQHHLTYMKYKYGGWFTTPPTLPAAGPCTLNAVVNSPFSCYVFNLPTGEQIWIEYRRNVGTYESRLPGSGLIMYIVNTTMMGNGYVNDPLYPGLLDEVYVYRPYVTLSVPDGQINSANYAWDVQHTAINLYTDPKPFSISSPGFTANLNIHSIQSNSGPQIIFEVATQVPVIWTGKTNSSWYTAGNWTTNTVPVSTDFVIIPQGQLYNCTVPISAGPTAVCGHLRLEYQLTMYPGSALTVNGSLYSVGLFLLDGTLQVKGNVTISVYNPGLGVGIQTTGPAQITFGGNCMFETGTTINLTWSTLTFANLGVTPTVCSFTVDAFGTILNNVTINKPFAFINYDSIKIFVQPTLIQGNLTVTGNSTFNINSPQDIRLDGNLWVLPTGVFNAGMGTIVLTGLPGLQTITISNFNSFVNNLVVDNNSAPALASNISIHGNFSINSGTLIANSSTIFLRGNWANNVGLGAFQKGTSRVVFQGSANQYITVIGNMGPPVESFNILELANPANSLIMNASGQQVQCDFYDYSVGTLLVTDGTFTAWSLLDTGITGDFICNGAGVIFLDDMTGNADLAANLTISGGYIGIISGNTTPGSNSTWGMYNGSLTMDSGTLAISNCGVNILPMGGTFNSNVTGGTIYVNGDFDVRRSEFAPTGGLVIISGSNPASIGAINGGSFYDLQLSSSTVSTIVDVTISNLLTIDSACTFSSSHNMNVNTVWDIGIWNVQSPSVVTGNTITINGTLNLNSGATLQIGNQIDVIGNLNCQGTITNPAVITGTARAYWKMNVNGTLGAVYTDFSKLRGEGIWVTSQGSIDQTVGFDNNSFTNGAGTCTFLTFANSQTLTINGIYFPSSSGASYNIAKTYSTGVITVNNATGSFAGTPYENDTYGLIDWIITDPNLIISSFNASNPNPYLMEYISYTVTLTNNSDYPVQNSFNIHFFQDRTLAPGWNENGDTQYSVGTMTAHESVTVTFTGFYSSSVSNWTSWLLIDPEGNVTETNEYDNLASAYVSWNPLPAIPTISITNTGSNTARITWTYPIWADEFDVYDDPNPYGSFTNLLGTTTNNYYDVSSTASQMFYLVVAKRNNPR